MEGAYCWRGVLLSKGGILRMRFGGLDSGALFFTGGGLALSNSTVYIRSSVHSLLGDSMINYVNNSM